MLGMHKLFEDNKDSLKMVGSSDFYLANDKVKEDMKTNTVIVDEAIGYGYHEYYVLSNPFDLSGDALAALCDKGRVPFGYSKSGNTIKIYTD